VRDQGATRCAGSRFTHSGEGRSENARARSDLGVARYSITMEIRRGSGGIQRAWALVLVLAAACGTRDRGAHLGGEFDGPGGVVPDGPCIDGATQRCAIEIGRHGDVLDCAPGVKRCQGGVWSSCVPDGTTRSVMAPPPKPAGPSHG